MDEREMFEGWWHANETWPVKIENIAFLAWQAARRTTPDREAIIAAAWKVVREALDDVTVHPCDQHDDDVKARSLPLHMHALYLALRADGDKGGASIKLAHYDAFDDAEKAVQKDVEVLRKLLKGD